MSALDTKYTKLTNWFKEAGKVAIAYSGGVDSNLLLAVAHETLGEDAFAFQALTSGQSKQEYEFSRSFCAERKIPLHTFELVENDIEDFINNPPNRCYLCKKTIFTKLKHEASIHGIQVVCEGSNIDDTHEDRPGHKALLELSVNCPLLECGFTKNDVRALSKQLGLSTWDKASFTCYYTRFAYGEQLDSRRIEAVQRGEDFLLAEGFRSVRIRIRGMQARIEVSSEQIQDLESSVVWTKLAAQLQEQGFETVTLDLNGYKFGGAN